jgi:hypothetical protein
MLGLEVVPGDGITFAALLTAAGAGIAAGLVTTTVSLIKTAFAKTPVGNWDGMMMAFTLSAFLYVHARRGAGRLRRLADVRLGCCRTAQDGREPSRRARAGEHRQGRATATRAGCGRGQD